MIGHGRDLLSLSGHGRAFHPGIRGHGRRFDGQSSLPAPPEGANIFYAEDYGDVDPTGTIDCTAAMRAARVPARAYWDGLSDPDAENAKIIPSREPGEFLMCTQGLLRCRYWAKAAGTWGYTQWWQSEGTIRSGLTYSLSDPTPEDGSDGDYWGNGYTNRLFLKTAGTWAYVSRITEYSAPGVSFGVAEPYDADGEDGDVYFQVRIINSEPAILADTDWSHITICGLGINESTWSKDATYLTKIKLTGWGAIPPENYEVDHTSLAGENLAIGDKVYKRVEDGKWWKSVLTTATKEGIANGTISSGQAGYIFISTELPGIELWWDQYGNQGTLGQARIFGRGNFCTMPSNSPAVSFHIEDLEISAGMPANFNNDYYSPAQQLDGWDESNKCLAATFGGTVPVVDCQVNRCKIYGFKGEPLYAGGDNAKAISFTDVFISETNASAVSCSASLALTNCHFLNVYNGVENLCFNTPSHGLTISGGSIDQQAGGNNAIVVLGELGGNVVMSVDGMTMRGNSSASAGTGFLIERCMNQLTVTNCTIDNYRRSVYFIDLSDGVYASLATGFDDVVFDGNTFVRRNSATTYFFGEQISVHRFRRHEWRNNVVSILSGTAASLTFAVIGHQGTITTNFDVKIHGNTIPSGVKIMDFNDRQPLVYGNTGSWSEQNAHPISGGYVYFPIPGDEWSWRQDTTETVPGIIPAARSNDTVRDGMTFINWVQSWQSNLQLKIDPASWNNLTETIQMTDYIKQGGSKYLWVYDTATAKWNISEVVE